MVATQSSITDTISSPPTSGDPRAALFERLLVLLLVATVVALDSHGAQLGLSSHGDSRAIVENSIPAILHGSYVPSRSLGVPLYEAIGALLYGATGSLRALNWYSVVLTLASLLAFTGLLDRSLTPTRRALVITAFALNPLVLINSSAVIEWAQSLLLMVLLLGSSKAWVEHRRVRDLVAYGVFSALLVLTRPDAIFICFALVVALAWEAQFATSAVRQLLLANGVAGAFTAGVFVVINGGLRFINGIAPFPATLLRRLQVATFGLLDVFGPVGFLVLIPLAFVIARGAPRRNPAELSFWGRLLLVAAPVMGCRFVLSPDKLEYMLPLLVVVLLAVAYERLSSAYVAVVAISMIATSAACVSIFERTGAADRLTLAIGVNKGAVAQDWEVTHFNQVVTTRWFLDRLADIVYAGEPGPQPQLSAPNFHIGLTSDMNDLIIGEQQLYQLDNPRFPLPIYRRSSYRKIYICDGSLRRFKPGWRVFQRQPDIPRIDPQTGRIALHCKQEGPGDRQ